MSPWHPAMKTRPSAELWRRVWDAVGPLDEDARRAWLTGVERPVVPLHVEDQGPSARPRFAAWDIQERARDSDGEERARWLDRAIEAFDAIADDPRDPGNDEGPFHAVARWMDRDQVGRALAVLERMAPHPWPYRVGGSRAALVGRLAALGDLDAAWGQLARFDRSDPFAGHWIAQARGSWAAFATHLSVAERLQRLDLSEMSEEERWLVLRTASGEGPVHDHPRDWLEAHATLEDPQLRSLGVRYLAADRWEALPSSEWIRAVRRESDASTALLGLVDEGGVEVLRAAEAELRTAPEGDAFAELLRHPMADPWVVEASGWAWLEGNPGRYELDPGPLRHWLERRTPRGGA